MPRAKKSRAVQLQEAIGERMEVLRSLTPFAMATEKLDKDTQKTIKALERKSDALAEKQLELRRAFTVFDIEEFRRITRPPRVNEHATA